MSQFVSLFAELVSLSCRQFASSQLCHFAALLLQAPKWLMCARFKVSLSFATNEQPTANN